MISSFEIEDCYFLIVIFFVSLIIQDNKNIYMTDIQYLLQKDVARKVLVS